MAAVDQIARSYLAEQTPTDPIERVLVLLCGVTHSGKTTLARRDPGLGRLARIEGDGLRNLLTNRPHDLRRTEHDGRLPDQDTIPRPRRNALLGELTDAVFDLAFAAGVGLLQDASNKSAAARKRRLQQAKAAGYRTAIVEVMCPLPTVLARIDAHDDALEAAGRPRFWRAEYERSHEGQLEAPQPDEADEVIAVAYDTPDPVPLRCLG